MLRHGGGKQLRVRQILLHVVQHGEPPVLTLALFLFPDSCKDHLQQHRQIANILLGKQIRRVFHIEIQRGGDSDLLRRTPQHKSYIIIYTPGIPLGGLDRNAVQQMQRILLIVIEYTLVKALVLQPGDGM